MPVAKYVRAVWKTLKHFVLIRYAFNFFVTYAERHVMAYRGIEIVQQTHVYLARKAFFVRPGHK